VVLSGAVVDTSRDLDDFRRFLLLRLFRLRFYKVFEGDKPVYCVGLVARCEDPDGWFAVWRRCYDSVGKARELFAGVEALAKNRLGELLLVEVNVPTFDLQEVAVD
jgi:hypothetical protein